MSWQASGATLDHPNQLWRFVRHHLSRAAVVPQSDLQEPSRGHQVPSAGDVAAQLVDRLIHVAPDTDDLDVGLIHLPVATDGAAAGHASISNGMKRCTQPYRVT
jgi:hypothetical protein